MGTLHWHVSKKDDIKKVVYGPECRLSMDKSSLERYCEHGDESRHKYQTLPELAKLGIWQKSVPKNINISGWWVFFSVSYSFWYSFSLWDLRNDAVGGNFFTEVEYSLQHTWISFFSVIHKIKIAIATYYYYYVCVCVIFADLAYWGCWSSQATVAGVSGLEEAEGTTMLALERAPRWRNPLDCRSSGLSWSDDNKLESSFRLNLTRVVSYVSPILMGPASWNKSQCKI